jgi:amidase
MASDPVCEVDAAVGDRIEETLAFLGKARVRMKDARPAFDMGRCLKIFVTMMIAALSARQPEADFKRNLEAAAALDPKDDSVFAAVIRGRVMRHKDWLVLNEQRHQMRRQWARFFEDYDVLLCPVSPVTAFPHDHADMETRQIRVNGRMRPYDHMFFWAGLTGISYLPATVAPIGQAPNGLPVGLQIVGPQFGDRTTIAFAQALEREFRGFEPPPAFA